MGRFLLSIGIGVVCAAAAAAESPETDFSAEQLAAQRSAGADFHALNKLEIKAAELAATRAASPTIKAYADRILRDHRLAEKMLNQVAEQGGFTGIFVEPLDPSAGLKSLAALQGEAFDAAYLKFLEDRHGKNIATLRDDEQKLPSSDIRRLLEKWSPILGQHELLALEIEKTKGTR